MSGPWLPREYEKTLESVAASWVGRSKRGQRFIDEIDEIVSHDMASKVRAALRDAYLAGAHYARRHLVRRLMDRLDAQR